MVSFFSSLTLLQIGYLMIPSIYVTTTLLCGLGVLAFGQVILARRQRVKKTERVLLPAELFHRSAAFMFLLAGLLLQPQMVPAVLFIAGLAIAAYGIWFSLWAQYTLGRNWIPGIGTHRGHKLIMTGPYRKIRHPIYSGIALYWIGTSIGCMNPLFLVAGFMMFLSVAIRAPHEEARMRKKFKKRWEAYEATTSMFIPRR